MKNTGQNITPLDGRNQEKIKSLIPYFSEFALNKYRILIELSYLQHLAKNNVIPKLTNREYVIIKKFISAFSDKDFLSIKKIENKINHDVKAVEYYLREKFNSYGLEKYSPYIHMGLTSEDTNNLSYALILKNFNEEIVIKNISSLLGQLKKFAFDYKDIPMLGRTHGQPAVPTTVGKEFANYFFRLKKQLNKLKSFKFEGKLNGAVGNHNALNFVFPDMDWIGFSDDFVSSFGLTNNIYTTQVLPYDNFLEYFQIINLINGIFTDLSVNIWQYIMLGVFVQQKAKEQVGSSTMPQKINPINFEHAEGSLQLANSIFDFYGRKLVSSRLQRDLSDSAVRRTFSEAFGYSFLGWQSIAAGLNKIYVNRDHLRHELGNHWEVLSEAIQVYLRSVRDEKAYEKLKNLTQGKTITKELYFRILEVLKLDKNKKFQELTPEKYIGLAKKIVGMAIK